MNPPWDALAVKKRIGSLKDKIVKLKKIEEKETEEIYKEKANLFYGKLRETWERFVEEILLNRVVQRFGREIQTSRIKILADITDEDYQLIEGNMKKCSTYMSGHDSSDALIENMPDSNEIEGDVKVLSNYLGKMRKRGRH